MSARSHQAQGTPRPEALLRFGQWVFACRYLPSVTEVIERFEVSRATAYRWLAIARTLRGSTTP